MRSVEDLAAQLAAQLSNSDEDMEGVADSYSSNILSCMTIEVSGSTSEDIARQYYTAPWLLDRDPARGALFSLIKC